jgi:hypothetical protein
MHRVMVAVACPANVLLHVLLLTQNAGPNCVQAVEPWVL